MRQIILAGFALIAVLCHAAMAAALDDKHKEILVLLEHSGLTQVIEQLPQFIQEGMNDSLQGQESEISRDDVSAISNILQQSFASDVIMHDTIAHMELHYDKQRITHVLNYLTSPLGAKMIALEKASSTPASYEAMLDYAAKLEASPPDEGRVAVLLELDRASHTTELTVAMQLEIFRTIMLVMGAYASEQGAPQLAGDMLEQTIAVMAEHVREEAQGMTLISFLFTYQDASDTELREYIKIHNDQDIQWYLALSSSALIHSLSRAMGKAGQGIVRHLRGTERSS
ncbi:MAG: hypothetical protein FD165_532 [Gammaproteobacteria bacterium]|nr:MAG: hypothetical protein FD165_532 [Gammaproteobacteria bacterium]TND02206.1 MAG: hypothetical protein FD120_2370 [Gammaproteobacteria bacterium]